MSKPEFEFFPSGTVEWTRVPGQAEGLRERILAKVEGSSIATRILDFAPGADSSPNGPQVHDFWEEVFIIEGEMTDVTLGLSISAGDYACRPPGMKHGPWRAGENGCRMFEVRYKLPEGD